jgi:Herpesviridae UL52/UL70 DNA primase
MGPSGLLAHRVLGAVCPCQGRERRGRRRGLPPGGRVPPSKRWEAFPLQLRAVAAGSGGLCYHAATPVLTSKFTAVCKGGTDDDPVFFARSTSRYCLNIGKEHNSNNVYFLLGKQGAYQMCFCRCETLEGRRHGMCKDFHSAVFPLTKDLTIALFGREVWEEHQRAKQARQACPTESSIHLHVMERLMKSCSQPARATKKKQRFKRRQ